MVCGGRGVAASSAPIARHSGHSRTYLSSSIVSFDPSLGWPAAVAEQHGCSGGAVSVLTWAGAALSVGCATHSCGLSLRLSSAARGPIRNERGRRRMISEAAAADQLHVELEEPGPYAVQPLGKLQEVDDRGVR